VTIGKRSLLFETYGTLHRHVFDRVGLSFLLLPEVQYIVVVCSELFRLFPEIGLIKQIPISIVIVGIHGFAELALHEGCVELIVCETFLFLHSKTLKINIITFA